MSTDPQGLALTAATPDAVASFNAAIDDFLDYRGSAFGNVKAAIDADPNFVMALCFRGFFFQMMETTAVAPKVQGWVDHLTSLADGATARERGHIRALTAWVQGDIMGATREWELILTEHPRDILALKLHHYLTFWTGRTHALRAATAGVLPAWDEATPGYASVLGMHAFALEETGNHIEAESWGREAVERNPNDLWAIHAVAHVLETQGRSDEGVDWLDYPTTAWDDRNPFRGHVWWHAALFNAAQANFDKVLDLYDNEISSVNTKNNVDVQNLASLLARLQLRGVDIGDRWEALADHSEVRIGDHAIAFNDMHWSLSLAAAGRNEAATRHADALAAHAKESDLWNASVFRSVGTDLCRGMAAWGAGDFDAASDLMWRVKDDLAPIGGSHAQRDLFPQLLGDALLKAGRFAQARSLFAERVTLRPSARTDWEHLAEALTGLDRTDEADDARKRAASASEPAA